MNNKIVAPNKRKIINDPVHGFIKLPSDFVYELMDHPFIQRLRRIKQLGFTSYVYPGATHSRFQHAVGAAHLMTLAIQNIRNKGFTITNAEQEAAVIAILLHDIGHGPFSHSLENSIIPVLNHEKISAVLMDYLNHQFNGKLNLALKIFNNKYEKKFLHQLVSSQLDMDRLDYLKRDSFYTGVTEGIVGSDRIIKMLNVVDGNLVVEAKGIYSIEKFLIARWLMYWQVYLHKTVIAAENLLIKTLQRAKEIHKMDKSLFMTPALKYFMGKDISYEFFEKNKMELIQSFILLDDNDILSSVKTWTNHPDKILSILSYNLVNRRLPRVKLQKNSFNETFVKEIKKHAKEIYSVNEDEVKYLVTVDAINNNAYSENDEKIQILYNTGKLEDIATASDIFNVNILYNTVKKYFICYPKNCEVII